MINKISICRKCNLCNNQMPLLDHIRHCDIVWVGLSAKKVNNINESIPLDVDTNSGKLISEIEMKNKSISFYKTNLVKCLPLKENGKIRYPSKEEMTLCIDNLFLELSIFKPKIVFLLGNTVSDFVLKYIDKNDKNIDTKFISVEHPSYICVYKRKYKNDYIDKINNYINEEVNIVS